MDPSCMLLAGEVAYEIYLTSLGTRMSVFPYSY